MLGTWSTFSTRMAGKRGFRYAGLGQLVERLDPDGTAIAFEYDTEEQLVAVVNQRRERYQFVYDELGRVTREIDYWGHAIDYVIDAAGNAVEVIDPLGRSARIAHDSIGRMTERTYADGVVERFAYDVNGNLVLAENNTTSVRREFDEEGNLLVEIQGGFTVTNTFDLLGRRLQRESGCGNVLKLTYDACDRPSVIELNGWPILSATYGANGQVSDAIVGRNLRRTFNTTTMAV